MVRQTAASYLYIESLRLHFGKTSNNSFRSKWNIGVRKRTKEDEVGEILQYAYPLVVNSSRKQF